MKKDTVSISFCLNLDSVAELNGERRHVHDFKITHPFLGNLNDSLSSHIIDEKKSESPKIH